MFSQFPAALDAVCAALAAAGVAALRGSDAAAEFSTAGCTAAALALDLRVAAVGLNLVAASHVFLLEPSTNPALEQQAVVGLCKVGSVWFQLVPDATLCSWLMVFYASCCFAFHCDTFFVGLLPLLLQC